MKISEAMNFKREIRTSCNLDAKMLDTTEDGMVLTVEKRMVNATTLELMTNFVSQHKLSLLSESGRYFISTSILAPVSRTLY